MRTDHREPLADTRGRFVHEIEWADRPWPRALTVAVRFLACAFCVAAWVVFLIACLKVRS